MVSISVLACCELFCSVQSWCTPEHTCFGMLSSFTFCVFPCCSFLNRYSSAQVESTLSVNFTGAPVIGRSVMTAIREVSCCTCVVFISYSLAYILPISDTSFGNSYFIFPHTVQMYFVSVVIAENKFPIMGNFLPNYFITVTGAVGSFSFRRLSNYRVALVVRDLNVVIKLGYVIKLWLIVASNTVAAVTAHDSPVFIIPLLNLLKHRYFGLPNWPTYNYFICCIVSIYVGNT